METGLQAKAPLDVQLQPRRAAGPGRRAWLCRTGPKEL
jgi:hypothetical protein